MTARAFRRHPGAVGSCAARAGWGGMGWGGLGAGRRDRCGPGPGDPGTRDTPPRLGPSARFSPRCPEPASSLRAPGVLEALHELPDESPWPRLAASTALRERAGRRTEMSCGALPGPSFPNCSGVCVSRSAASIRRLSITKIQRGQGLSGRPPGPTHLSHCLGDRGPGGMK